MKKHTDEKQAEKQKELAVKVGALIRELADGNETALDRLYVLTGKWLNTWAKYYLVDKSYSEDVLSVVYAKLVVDAPKYCEKNVLNWIIKITKNIALNFNRSLAALSRREVSLDENLADKEWADERLKYLLVESAVKKLTPLEQRYVYLRFWKDVTIEELGRILNMPPSTVQYRIDKILLKLRGMLDDEKN